MERDCVNTSAKDADVLLAEVQAQLNDIQNPVPGSVKAWKRRGMRKYRCWMDCLNSGARSGRPQALSEAKKGHPVAIAKGGWDTLHMTLIEIQRGAGLGHVDYATGAIKA